MDEKVNGVLLRVWPAMRPPKLSRLYSKSFLETKRSHRDECL